MASVEPHKDLPQYAPGRLIRERLVHVSNRKLREWAARGYVRSLKLGDSRQDSRLFCVPDIADLCERMSRGYAPRQKRRS